MTRAGFPVPASARPGPRALAAPAPRPALSGARAGFTLLEILLSLVLVSMMLVALNTFVFSMGELWGRNADVRLFDQHVRAVTRFLQETIRTATLPPSARAGAQPVAPMEIHPQSGPTDTLLTFELPAGSRFLTWPDRPLPEVVCSLQAREGTGLLLLWHSRLETNFDTDPPRESVVTPLVSALAYDYYDADARAWSTVTAFKTDTGGLPLAPQRVRVTFKYGKMTKESLVTLDPASEGLPTF